jgi:hypothetical protein
LPPVGPSCGPLSSPVERIRPASDVKLVPRCVGRGTDRIHRVQRAARPTWTAGRDITSWGRRSSWRMPVAGDAGTCRIVAAQAPLPTGRLKSARPKDDELRQAVGGVLVMTIVGDMSDGAIAPIDLSSSLPDPCASWGPTRHQMFPDEGNVVLAACPLEPGARVRILPGLTV